MNFLAHLYLSGSEPDLVVGNFIGDFVRGRGWQSRLTPSIARGVHLHRAIDRFTDQHPVVKRSRTRLWPRYRHYASVIVDVYYDHYLAAHWDRYSAVPLAEFAAHSYRLLVAHDGILPDRVRTLLPHMIGGNWLLNYAHIDGIARALRGMSRRASAGSKLDRASGDLTAGYDAFESEFLTFFPELRAHVDAWLASSDPYAPRQVE